MSDIRILILSPYFAPSSAIGAARMTSLAAFLSDNGYQVDVVSLGRCYQIKDKWNRKIPKKVVVHEVDKGDRIKGLREKTERLLSRNKFSLLISSMGPFETICFVPAICKESDVPYILDYRDAWLFYRYYYESLPLFIKFKQLIRDIYYIKYEYIGIKDAAAVVTVTDKNTIILKKRYKKFSNKILTIYNGHDALPKTNERKYLKGEIYTIGCAGKFLYYNKTFAMGFLKVINDLWNDGYKVRLLHIGNETDDATELVSEEGMNPEIYSFLGQYQYEDAMKFLSTQNSVLIIYGTYEGLGTKVFDYIGLNKPIIYYGVYPSELSKFVSGFSNTIATSNPDELGYEIKNFIERGITKLEGKKRDDFSRLYQNVKYKELIGNIIDNI